MDVIPVYPENHGAMIGAAKMAWIFAKKARRWDISSDLCSYARAISPVLRSTAVRSAASPPDISLLQQYLRDGPQMVRGSGPLLQCPAVHP